MKKIIIFTIIICLSGCSFLSPAAENNPYFSTRFSNADSVAKREEKNAKSFADDANQSALKLEGAVEEIKLEKETAAHSLSKANP